uniref:Uncharacterized protein n=1 Tax=Rhizobium rhizogenes TaxID=359 RepID=A0A7S4ZT82_RHIRH|nr:hypothetical protein pC5.8b_367 [Rhizobium rhizogenes]
MVLWEGGSICWALPINRKDCEEEGDVRSDHALLHRPTTCSQIGREAKEGPARRHNLQATDRPKLAQFERPSAAGKTSTTSPPNIGE